MSSKDLEQNFINNCRESFDYESKKGLMNIINNVGIEQASVDREVLRNANHLYSKKIDDWEVMDQKQSGRCWIFAGMNLYKPVLCEKLNIKDIKLSANYVQFWDFFEKANLFLNNIERTIDESVDSRLVHDLLCTTFEGGWWDMFIVLIDKYGVVPDDVMPDTFDASRSANLSKTLGAFMRRAARDLRNLLKSGASESEINSLKEERLSTVYEILVMHLGMPPQKFSWSYEDKDKKLVEIKDTTPLEFCSKLEVKEYITLINDPRSVRPFKKRYSCDYVGSIEGEYLNFLNLDIETFKGLVKKMVDSGSPVWMSADVGKLADHKNGIFNADLYKIPELLGIPQPMKKADRLDYADGGGNHAMLFTGYHEENGKIVKWRVENSWGDEKGKKGYYEMSDEWFTEHVYTSLISTDLLTDEQREILSQDAVKLMPWELPY